MSVAGDLPSQTDQMSVQLLCNSGTLCQSCVYNHKTSLHWRCSKAWTQLSDVCWLIIAVWQCSMGFKDQVTHIISFYTWQHICYSAYMLPPVRPSATQVDQSETAEVRITIFSPYSSSITLVFRQQVSSRKSEGFPRAGALNEGGVGKIGDFQTSSRHITETVQDRTKVAIDH